MHESIETLEEYMSEINVQQYQNNQLNTFKKLIDQLNNLENLLEHVFGTPQVPLQNSLVEPQAVWNNADKGQVEDFERSTWDLVSNLQQILNVNTIPQALHHILVAHNDCALQTLQLIRRYNLAPPGLNQQIQDYLRSRQGLAWFIGATANSVVMGSKFQGDHSWEPYSEIQLKHHFRFSDFNKVFQDLAKKEQDWILFHYILRQLDPSLKEFIDDEYTTEKMKQDESWNHWVLFTRKLRNFLSKELEGDNQEGSSRRFLMDVRDDLVAMAKVCIDPQNAWINHNSMQGDDCFILGFLRFLHHRLGLKYMISEIFGGEVGINQVEFEQKFSLYNLAYDIEIWKDMLLDYSYYTSITSAQGPKVKNISTKTEKEVMKNVYWKNLRDKFIEYKKENARNFDSDKDWKKKLRNNLFYKNLLELLDTQASHLGELYHKIKSM
ncbi:hypothetical protein VP01_524g3 [Puccinia sorghi]|uniref:Uncharacterized protein n=1 Tax=Puccinia sorghi TaxID=27349 RepID=A0A0L6UL90_9BASI|nr:hypothetical protein VP01_524g3 [Puccinia sorghi]